MRQTQTISLSFSSGKKYLALFLKIIITICALVFIYHKLKQEDISWSLWLSQMEASHLGFAWLAFTLIPLNWGLEAWKWKYALNGLYPDYSFRVAFRGVIAGVATGIFTPNRIGDYAGRLMYLKAGKRWEAGVVLMLNRLTQMLITLWVGCYCFMYVLLFEYEAFQNLIPATALKNESLVVLLILVCLLFSALLIFSGSLGIYKWLPKKWKKSRQVLKKAFGSLSPQQILTMSLIGGVRFLVYSLQYAFLMIAFGFTGNPYLAFLLIGLVFLIKSLLPYFSFTELGLRESVALFVMGIWQVPALTAVSSTFILYLFNLILPAIVGLVLIQLESSTD
ncbi:MAG: lysylphosphatidylglycerol synthase transmembrane domain-containing protein [Bacteroidota bacterium]